MLLYGVSSYLQGIYMISSVRDTEGLVRTAHRAYGSDGVGSEASWYQGTKEKDRPASS